MFFLVNFSRVFAILEKLSIFYQDENMVVINKPPGFFVHRSSYDNTSTQIILPIIRDQLGVKVYPVHRLDRKTSGALVFALHPDAQRQLNQYFAEKKVKKEYLAIVRGYTEGEFTVDYPLTTERGDNQDALTVFKTISRHEIQVASSARYPTSRYSLVKAIPETGRQHQIRRHLAHMRNPIIGDRPYGCSKQNRFFLAEWHMSRMLLHAWKLEIPGLLDERPVRVEIPPDAEFLTMLGILGLTLSDLPEGSHG